MKKPRRHRFAWQRSRRRERWSGRGAVVYAPRSATEKRRALGCCVHCGTLTRFDPVGPSGGLVQRFCLPGDSMWMEEAPSCDTGAHA